MGSPRIAHPCSRHNRQWESKNIWKAFKIATEYLVLSHIYPHSKTIKDPDIPKISKYYNNKIWK